jgi:hypothetical protein
MSRLSSWNLGRVRSFAPIPDWEEIPFDVQFVFRSTNRSNERRECTRLNRTTVLLHHGRARGTRVDSNCIIGSDFIFEPRQRVHQARHDVPREPVTIGNMPFFDLGQIRMLKAWPCHKTAQDDTSNQISLLPFWVQWRGSLSLRYWPPLPGTTSAIAVLWVNRRRDLRVDAQANEYRQTRHESGFRGRAEGYQSEITHSRCMCERKRLPIEGPGNRFKYLTECFYAYQVEAKSIRSLFEEKCNCLPSGKDRAERT